MLMVIELIDVSCAAKNSADVTGLMLYLLAHLLNRAYSVCFAVGASSDI